jgi:PKD repeat protein
MKYIFLSLITVVSFNFSSQVQSTRIIDKTNCRDGEKVEYCKTHKVMHGLKTDPDFLKSYVADQKELKRIEKTIPSSLKSKVIYNIPLVFHVLHNNGSENISDEQIFDAVSILNRDYRLQNSDANNVQSIFSGMPADIEIEFALATKAPNGQCFSGITRTISALTNDGSSGNSQVSAIISGNDVYNNSWPGNKYLNIFVVGDADGAAGYTYNPSNFIGSSMSNGIWVLHDYVGSIGTSNTNSSRTLTHEVGHWLNLEHTWGPNNNPGNSSSCSDDDFVNDTPRCIGVTSCNLTSNSCSNDVVDGYWTTNVADNVENYMDYSYCSKMFTSGQKNRMRSALLSSVGGRNNIWSSSNLSVTGLNTTPSVCAVEIDVERDLVCSGDNVQFFDESYNNISSWNWTFPGATPSSSTQENPTVSYNGSGSYNVVLQVTDQLGNTLSKTFPNFITVMGNAGSGAPYLEGFESVSSLPSSDWTIINSGGPGFQVVSNVASSGSKSVKLDNSSGTTGDVDELISNPINLSNLTSASLSFKYAFAKRYNSNSDFLRILASNNCGETWVLRKNISSSIIATRSNTGSSYTPTAADWVTINVSGITSAYLVDDFRFKFEFNCGGGNDLFIDDINITGTLSINENEVIEDFIIYPNPANAKVAISFFSNTALNNASIMMFDASGRLVKNIISKDFQIGNQNIEFSIADIDNGWYFIQLDSPEGKTSSKLIKY